MTRSRARWQVAAGAWLLRVVCIGVVATAPLFGQVPTAGLMVTPATIGPNGIAIVAPTFANGTPVLTRTIGTTTITLPTPVSGSNVAQRLTATATYQLSVTNASNVTATATATVLVAPPVAGDWTSENNATFPVMTNVDARAIAFDPRSDNSQYLTASGNIFSTVTGGPPWISTTISFFANSNGLAIGHPNGSIISIWSLGDCDGVLWHFDGVIWTEVIGTANGLPAANCNPPATTGTGIVLDLFDPSQSTLYVAFTSGVFRSIDNGSSWANISPPTFAPSETPAKLAIADDGTVFVGTSLGNLFKLTAGNWTQLITAPFTGAPTITALSVDPGGTHVVIGDSDGFVRTSSNSGVTFTLGAQLGGGPSTYAPGTGGVNGIVVSPDGVTYAIANHRVFRSTDYGLTFTDETVTGAVPLPDDAYETIVVDPAQPQTVYVVGFALGVYKRTIGTPGAASDPVTLASGLNQPSNVAADLSAGYVYFTDSIDFASGQVGVVYKSGGKLTNVATGTNLFPGGLLPLPADLLFGTTPSAPAAIGAVLDASIGGGATAQAVATTATGVGVRSITADSNMQPPTIYFNQTDGTLQSFSLGQSTISSVSTGTTSVTANQMYVPTAPAIASNLYFCGTFGLFQMPKAGGTPARLDSNATGPCAFAGSFAYFTVFNGTPTNHIDVRKYDLTNVGSVNVGESTIVSNVAAVGNSPALATDGLLLYFATPASAATATDATIQQVVLATASAASFATNLNSVGGLALDGKRVYWTTSDGTTTGGKVQSAADRATTTISISNIPANAAYGGSFSPAYAYAGDGNTSTTSSTPGTCTVSGGMVSFVGVGTCTLTANATATTNFAAATGSAQSFTIGQGTTTISISNIPASAVSGGSFTPTFTYTGDGTTSVTSGTTSTCTVAGAVVNFVGTGTCTLTAHATAGTNYAAVDGSVQSFTIVQQATTALIVAPASGPYGGTASLNATLVLTSVGTGVGGQLVTFSLNGNPVGSATTDGNGLANVSVSIAGINGGVCTGCVTANFTGSTNYAASSGSNSLTVNQAPTTISINNIPGNAVYGGSFTPTFTYAGDGTISVTSGTTGTCTNTGAVVNFVGGGTCTLIAHATAGTYFKAVDGSAQSFSIGPATTTVLVAPSSGTYGSTASLNATLVLTSAGTGVGGQLVSFKLNGNLVGSGTTDGNGFAFVSASIAGINGGTYPGGITASFAGSANYAASSGSNSLTVNPATTTTTVTPSANPPVFGQSITFTANVTSSAGTVAGGTVNLLDGATTLGTATVSNGTAVFTTSSPLAVGSHTITASYGGVAGFLSSSGTLTETINKANSATTVTSSANPSVFGQTVTFAATAAAVAPGSGTPTGSIVFSDGSTSLGIAALTRTSLGATATLTTSALPAGGHTITTTYAGDANFNATTVSFTQTVNNAPTATTVTPSANPSVFGQSITFTANVTSSAGTVAGGTVNLLDGATTLGTATVSNGTAVFTTASPLAVGSHTITASYGGVAGFLNSSGTLTETINKANSATTVTSSANPSVFGQTVTFTATVAAVAPGSGTPTGTVTFHDGSNSISTVTLPNGVASLTLSLLTLGNHAITVSYSGDGSFNSGTSGPLTQTVNPVPTRTTVSVSPSTVEYSDYTTLTATITPTLAGGQTLTGTVQFSLNGTNVGSPVAINSSGVATLSNVRVNLPASSGYPVKAVFTSTNSNFSASSSSTTETVTEENAFILYSGDTIAQIGTTLNLRATVWDSAAAGYPGPNPETGPTATIGDITRMWVAFEIYPAGSCGSGTPMTLYAQVATTSTAGVGTATTTYTSSTENSYCVISLLVAGNGGGTNMYYTSADAQTVGIDFYMNSGQFATGGGWVIDPTTNGHDNFAFNARYNSTGSPKGQVVFIFRGMYNGVAADFIIKSNALSGLQFTGTNYPITATLQGKANVQINRASDGLTLVSAGNYTFSATVTDSGQNGTTGKQFSILVYDSSGVPYYSVRAGTALGGGNVVVHSH